VLSPAPAPLRSALAAITFCASTQPLNQNVANDRNWQKWLGEHTIYAQPAQDMDDTGAGATLKDQQMVTPGARLIPGA